MTLKVLADMTIGQWAELGISGVVLVAIGVALWLIVKTFRLHSAEIEQRNEDVSKREEALQKRTQEQFQQMLDSIRKEVKKSGAHVYTIEEDRKNDQFQSFLSKEIQEIHTKTMSSRTFFCMYHNGTHSLNNVNFYKFSLIDEAWDRNLASLHDKMQNYPATVYKGLSQLLKENRSGVVVKNINILYDDVALYQFFSERDVSCFVAQGVYKSDESNILLGFLINEYITPPSGWTDEDWKKVRIEVSRSADKIDGVLQVSSADEEFRKSKEEGK